VKSENVDLNNKLSVLKYIRDELDNYELARNEIVKQEFNNLTKISSKELELFIQDPTANQEKIKNIL
jgi:hypothetical protein